MPQVFSEGLKQNESQKPPVGTGKKVGGQRKGCIPWNKGIKNWKYGFKKGHIPWHAGKHIGPCSWKKYTKEEKEKMSKGGKHRYWLGKKLTKEHREKLSKWQKGIPKPWQKGRILSEET